MEMQNIYLLDSDKVTIGVLSNRMPFSLPFYDDLQERDLDEMTDTLTLSIPANHEKSNLVVAGNYLLYPKYEGDYRLYRIIETTETSDTNTYYKEVYAEVSAQDDLIKGVVRPTTFTSVTIDKVLDHILEGMPWEKGSIDDLGTQDVTIEDYPTKLEALVSVVKQYGGELDFEYVTKGTTIIAQRVSVYEQLGNKTGKPFMHGKDITGVERIEDRSSLVTALIGVGKTDESGTPLTFKDAPGVTQFIPKGYKITGDYVYSEEALKLYSNGEHIFGVFKDDNATSPQELFSNTVAALQENDRPKLTYKVEVALLERIAGYEHERVALGDTIFVQDKTVQPELYLTARIRKLSRSLTNPLNDAVELGDYLAVVPPVNARIAQLQAKVSAKEEIWNKAEEIPQMQNTISQLPTKDDLFSTQAQRLKVRYIRDWINGSDADSSNQWAELQVFKQGVNIAKGIIPTGSAALTNPEYLTDEIADSTVLVGTATGSQYVLLDLGSVVEDVEYIRVWHYFGDERSYNGHYTDVSEDGVNWVRLYNSDRHGTHKESSEGFIVPVNSSAIIATQEKQVTQVVTAFEELDEFKQSVEYELDQKTPLTKFNETVDTLNTAIADKADLEYVGGELKNKANIAETYTKTEVDNAVNSRVSKTDYETDETGRVQRFTSAESRIKQVEDEITVSLEGTSYDKLSELLKSNTAKITATAEALESKVEATEVKDIARRTGADIVKMRYVRVLMNGNTTNAGNHIVELRVMQEGVNLAKGKTPTASTTMTNPTVMTDDNYSSYNPYTSIGNGSQWVQLDLGQVYDNVDYIHLYLYWSDLRSYKHEVQVSEDSVNWVSLFDTEKNGNYTCTDAGFVILVNEQRSINTMATSIKQTADSITTKVEKNGVISAINQSPELITLSAKKINFDGAVLGSTATFSGTVKGAVIETNQTVDNKVNNARFDGAQFRFVRFKSGVTDPDTVNVDLTQIETMARVYQDGVAFTDGSKAMGLGLGSIVNDGQLQIMADSITISTATGVVFNNSVEVWKNLDVWGDVKAKSLSTDYSSLEVNTDLDMKNHNLSNVNHITINDPGSGEGIEWLSGNGWKIVEADYGMNNTSGDLQFATGSTPQMTVTTGGAVWIQGSFHGRSTGNTYFVSNGTSIFKSDASVAGSGIYVYGDSAGGRIWSMDVYNRTYSSSPNMYITSSGTLGRSTSASKYKLEIEEVDTSELAEKVLDLKPKSWFDKVGTEQLAEYITAKAKDPNVDIDSLDVPFLERHYGLIAEDLVEAGLGMYVLYGEPDEQGHREVEGIEYDRVWTLLIPLVKQQREQISKLEARLDALEAGQ
ncbi:phage tail spike protein [Bacillus subtilis]|uniref:phage tail spike protein n=1 Tax=Bacillus subtilis TaxID=1423 RepID=UPI0039E05BDA